MDLCSAISFSAFDSRSCVGVNLSLDFMNRVDVGKEYSIRVDVQKKGKKLGFNKIYFIDPQTNKYVISASHTIAITNETIKL